MKPSEQFKEIMQEVLVKRVGGDSNVFASHFLIVQHSDAEILEPGETELVVWAVDEHGCRDDEQFMSCHVGDGKEFNTWYAKALRGNLLQYLHQTWGDNFSRLSTEKEGENKIINGVKDMFKLAECRKSQAKNVHAWYWTFNSLLSDKVQVKVTTYGVITSDKKEEDAWKELEKTVCVFIDPSKAV